MTSKLSKILLVVGLLTSAQFLYASSKIEIENDADDCLEGWLGMDFTIKVDDESFDFRASCDFSFDEEFTTKSGVKCEIEAGMCSGFSPEKRFEVECDDGSEEGIDILCPQKP